MKISLGKSRMRIIFVIAVLFIIGVLIAAFYFQTQSENGVTPSPSPSLNPSLSPNPSLYPNPSSPSNPKANVSASSFYEDLRPDLAFDGNFTTRWISKDENRPWLQIDFDEPQNIFAVKIYFEIAAFGREYSIQTWNGEYWVTQIVEENNENFTATYHFPQVTSTTKLRLNFAGHYLSNLVGIYEVKINPKEDN
jgi:hypothetical protein